MSQKAGRPRSAVADAAITRAILKNLSAHGLAATTMVGVARDAGVSTATLYRRFNNLEEAAVDSISELVSTYVYPDLGSLRRDLEAYVNDLVDFMTDLYGDVVPVIVELANRSTELAEEMAIRLIGPTRREIGNIFLRAAQRSELRDDVDIELAIDLVHGPIYLRRMDAIRNMTERDVERLVDMVLGAVCPSGAT